MAIAADVVAFKHADFFYGADSEAARLLATVGYGPADLEAREGEYRHVATRGALAATTALFVGVGSLVDFGYDTIRALSRQAVDVAARELDVRHLAMTAHGLGVGLDEDEAFLSQVAGFVDALRRLDGDESIARITIVERNPGRVEAFGKAFADHLSEIPSARLETTSARAWRFVIGATPRGSAERATGVEPTPIPLLERTPDAEPHVFIAYPFQLRDHARFGIEGPSRQAGFLVRLIGDQVYTGEVLERIRAQIESAAFVVAVLTGANPNVYLEVGYAWGKGKTTVLVAQEDETLRFDVSSHRVLKYVDATDLESKFDAELKGLRASGAI